MIELAVLAAIGLLLVPRVHNELADIVEYRWSRWRTQRRLPRAQLHERSEKDPVR